MRNLFEIAAGLKQAPGSSPGTLNAAEVKASVLSGAVAFAAAWPSAAMTLGQVAQQLPDPWARHLNLLVATVTAAVAFGTQLFRLYRSGGPAPSKADALPRTDGPGA